MVGRGSLILVLGFATIFGYLNLKILNISNRSIVHVVGYNESNVSRNVANSGANVGLAMLAKNFWRRGVLKNQTFTSGPFDRCSYVITMDSIVPGGPLAPYIRLRSVGYCTTFARMNGNPVILSDTVEVRFDPNTYKSFSSLAWMTIQEGNVFFITGDTLWGQVHTNSNIHVDGSPVFMGKVTCSGQFDPKVSTKKKPTKNKAIFKDNYEEGVPEKLFPNDMSEVIAKATNQLSTRSQELWIELIPGSSADNDGYAIIRTGGFTGTKVDSMALSDFGNDVIYSSENVHVKGVLDGRLSIGSGLDVKIEGNTVYEKPPDPTKPADDPVNQATKDMLGLIANDNVIISKDHHGDIYIHASIFARTQSFEAEKYNTRGVEGRIYLIGSVAQHDRGPVGTFAGSTLNSGFYKSYRYDTRMEEDENNAGDPNNHPPAFPGFNSVGPLRVTNWWESTRVPFDIEKYE
jgi:hypothetical protein